MIEKIKRKLKVGSFAFTAAFATLVGVGCNNDSKANQASFSIKLDTNQINKNDIFDTNNTKKTKNIQLDITNSTEKDLKASEFKIKQDGNLEGVEIECYGTTIGTADVDMTKCGLSDINKKGISNITLIVKGADERKIHVGKITFTVTYKNQSQSVDLEINK